jgi:hypothetical protein
VTGKRTPRDDLKLIQTFASDTPYSNQQGRFRDWFKWCPSTAATRCPRTLAGKRCRSWTYGEPCMCQEHHHVLDHACRWIDKEGQPVLTSEPYDFGGEQFAGFVTECSKLGLRVSVSGTSPYFPGRTVLIIIRKREASR